MIKLTGRTPVVIGVRFENEPTKLYLPNSTVDICPNETQEEISHTDSNIELSNFYVQQWTLLNQTF